VSALPTEVARTLGRVRLLALDVDGVLTDGTLLYGEGGEVLKGFHVRDGLGLQRLGEAGVHVAILSGRRSGALARRVAELGIVHFADGVTDKAPVIAALASSLGIAMHEVAFAADDIVDLPALRETGVSIAVADAHPSVRAEAAWITTSPGGRGAVREISDAILTARSAQPSAPCAPADARAGDAAARAPASFHVVIPARYAATRLPGKPLRMLGGRPLVAHAWTNATACGAGSVLVATDDPRVQDAVSALGGRAVLTASDHASGTDRIAEVADREGFDDDAILVNLQADEPFLGPALIRALAEGLAGHPHAGIATLATPIQHARELFDPNVVKVALDDRHAALYFSRAPIPWVRDVFGPAQAAVEALPPEVPFLRHIGIYAYRVATLRRLRDAKPHPLEQAEKLEQLRALALGIQIHVEIVDPAPPPGVDTPEDLRRAAARLRRSK
jgi:3-deoxy-manno-octulosonate cytidylyltransferase (CMP-KDO synthetase)